MNTQTSDQLVTKKCAPCEGGVDAYPRADALAQLEKLPDWHLTADDAGRRRVVIDQVASLTDASALAWHAALV